MNRYVLTTVLIVAHQDVKNIVLVSVVEHVPADALDAVDAEAGVPKTVEVDVHLNVIIHV